MNTIIEGLHEVFLNPGEVHFGEGKTRISTLLGSCVAITLWHPHQRIGGMCHYPLAERGRPTDAALDGRFGNEAFTLFLQYLGAAGTSPSECQAKLFGGGNMLSHPCGSMFDIGHRNIEYGRQWLASRQIALIAEHVGGSGRRKLHFDLWSGDAWLSFPQGSDAHIRSPYG